MSHLPSVLMVGTGEYTTGYIEGGKTAASDKKFGVVALAMFYMRSKGKLGRILMAGSNGTKFPAIRKHFDEGLKTLYKDIQDVSVDTFPDDDKRDPKAYLKAMDQLSVGDLVIVFTPDDTHYEIVKAAVVRGLHVLVTKPAVKTFEQHAELISLATKHNSLVCVELHKRWDPIYQDARAQMQGFGDFSYFTSYMSQPKKQLETFRGWKWGKGDSSSDISYYLNSHHVDFHCWVLRGKARPIRVVAMASTGVASSEPFKYDTEDTITLLVQWENLHSRFLGTAIYTSSWIAPSADVHTQQRIFYMGHKGELNVDQAHRGYNFTRDIDGFRSTNPLFMKYAPDANGNFGGQHAYAYLSFEAFVEAATKVKNGLPASALYQDGQLGTLHTTLTSTTILEGGRISLDEGRPILIRYVGDDLEPQGFEKA